MCLHDMPRKSFTWPRFSESLCNAGKQRVTRANAHGKPQARTLTVSSSVRFIRNFLSTNWAQPSLSSSFVSYLACSRGPRKSVRRDLRYLHPPQGYCLPTNLLVSNVSESLSIFPAIFKQSETTHSREAALRGLPCLGRRGYLP
jgi:hypothetical protein